MTTHLATTARWGTAIALLLVTALGAAPPLRAAVITDNTCLPPGGPNTAYLGTALQWNALAAVLSTVEISGFETCALAPLPGFGPILESGINSLIQGDLDIESIFNGHVASNAHFGEIITSTGISGSDSFFDAEIIQLDIDLGGGMMIRESPTLASAGETTITDLGGGSYRIDSFFDVFTELSLDDGQTWIPSNGSVRLHLEQVPEPSAVCFLAGGLVLFAGLLRRR